MSSFSPADAAFEGFRLTRERPRAVIAWALCYLLFTFLISAIADLTLGSQSKALIADLQRAGSDPAAFWPAAQKMAPFFLAGLPLSLAFQAVFTCAIYRAILRPAESSRGYLRLGLDELRMMVLNLILAVIWGATIFVFLLVTLVAAATAGTAGESITVLIGDVVTVGVFCAAVTVAMRLSLAGPMTFADRRLRVFASWTMSKGLFWRLFGAYVLSLILAEAELLPIRPLLLLDDVLSELDAGRRRALGERIATAGQTVVTATEASALPFEPAQVVHVEHGSAT